MKYSRFASNYGAKIQINKFNFEAKPKFLARKFKKSESKVLLKLNF